MGVIAAILMLALCGCVGTHRIDYGDTATPTLWLVEQPVAGAFTHPAFAYSEGYGWGMVELLAANGPTYTTPPRITHGRIRGRWYGETARAWWHAVVMTGRYREWTRPYTLGDSNAYAAWLNEQHPLPGFDLGSRAYGEGNAIDREAFTPKMEAR